MKVLRHIYHRNSGQYTGKRAAPAQTSVLPEPTTQHMLYTKLTLGSAPTMANIHSVSWRAYVLKTRKKKISLLKTQWLTTMFIYVKLQ